MEDMGCPYSCFALSAPIRDGGGGGGGVTLGWRQGCEMGGGTGHYMGPQEAAGRWEGAGDDGGIWAGLEEKPSWGSWSGVPKGGGGGGGIWGRCVSLQGSLPPITDVRR